MAKDLYGALGVNRSADADEIKKAYRKLARKYHPDVNPGDAAAEARFKEVSSAHDVLSDPKKRKLYDEFGDQGLREGFNAEQARAYGAFRGGSRGGQGFGGGFGEQPDLSDLFGNIFGRGGAGGFGGGQRARPSKGRDVEASLELDFIEALKGSEQALTLRGANGEDRQIRVRIPPGATDGSKLRLGGKGGQSHNGGPSGDLILSLAVRPHPFLTRIGDDLEMKVPLTVGEALRGARVTVPTLDGQVTLTVPTRSQNGTRMRLRGKGVPRKAGPAGDLYVVLTVELPTGESEELNELADAMDDHYTSDVRAGLQL